MAEHSTGDDDRSIVEQAVWRVWRTSRDARLVSATKKKANLTKGMLLKRRTKLREKLLQVFRVRMHRLSDLDT
jgi:hypothetical protein